MGMRPERMAEAIKRLVSEVMQRGLNDPRIKFVTITNVEVTPDLRLAKIFYSVMGDQKEKKAVAAGLKSAKSYVKRHVGDNIRVRHVPDIVFKADSSSEYRARIDNILNKISKEKKNEGNEESHNSD
ncbi:MAG: 30S ribosome-binding factor RbfA [Candidatus Omnitrophica bacterium]|nr:30S ribosome-binding factor RbfA [Candidatus Omnitrophota bacterium]